MKKHMLSDMYDMGERPLMYDVKCNTKVVIPAGTKHVLIGFGKSHLTRIDKFGRIVHLNTYYYNGILYHA